MKKISIKSIIAAFFVIAFSFIAFFVIATFNNLKETQIQNRNVNVSLQVLLSTQVLLDRLQEFETAEQGFLFLPSEKFAIPFNNSIAALTKCAGNLATLAVNNPDRKPELDLISRLLTKKIADAKKTAATTIKNGDSPIAAIGNPESVKEFNDSIRTAVSLLEEKDHAVLSASNQYLEDIADKTTYRFLLMVAVFFFILIIFLLNILADLKKREMASEQLRYQASLIETIPDAVFTTDKNFIVKTWNKYAAEMYGLSAEEAIGKNMRTLFSVQIDSSENNKSLSSLNANGFYKDEYRVIKKNNEQIYVLASINTLTNNLGDITGYVAVHRDITERKKLEDNQKEFNLELGKQVKLKTAETTNILERITDGFLALDNQFTFSFVNKKAGEILGFPPENMIGKNIFRDFPDTISDSFNKACLQSFQTQQYYFLENYYRPLDSWLENDIYPSTDGLSIFFKDSTFKKKAEMALLESEERYRHLIEHIHAGVVVHKPDSSVLLSNQEASRILGLSSDQMLGKTAIDPNWNFVSVAGKNLKADEYPVMQVINSGKPLNNIIAGIDNPANKTRVWVLVNAFPEFDNSLQLKQVVVTFVDITDQKKAEEELKRNEDILNMAQNIAKIGSWEFNLQTQDLKWSNELYRIFELEHTANDKLYESYRNKFHPDDLKKLDAVIEHSITNGKGYTIQHRIVTNDGSIKHILGIGEIVADTKGEITGMKGTGQDITALVKSEEKLQHSYKEIKQLLNHLQEIREQERTNIAREIHDELGQQLTGLKMYISSLNKKIISQDADIKEKFTATLELIEDTIKSVRKISTDLRPSMLDDLGLLAALEWQSNEFEKRSGIITAFTNLTENREVPTRLKTGFFRIFQESLTNVARHADAKKVTASLKFENNCFILTITDDGKGFLVKNIGSKKTLGLFGMKERTLEMGGEYKIKSEPGNGTTVSITVPLNN